MNRNDANQKINALPRVYHGAPGSYSGTTSPTRNQAADIKAVILNHLHNDHAGGLEDFVAEAPDLLFYVSREHWEAYGEQTWFARMEEAAPNHWPEGFAPRIVDLEDKPLGPWKQSFPFTISYCGHLWTCSWAR